MLRLREISIRIKLAMLTSAVIALVVLGQTFQSLATEAVETQERATLRARVVMLSVAGAVGALWTDEQPPDLAPYAERIGRDLDVENLAVVADDGRLLGSYGPSPTADEIRRVIKLRLRMVPRSLIGLTSGPIELMVATPIMRGHDLRAYLFCTFRSHEPAERMRSLIFGALLTAAFWVAVGAALTIWMARRLTRPLAQLAAALSGVGRAGYQLPKEGRAEGEIGVVQDQLVAMTERIADEHSRVEELNAALRHQVDVVSADLERAAAQRTAILDSTRDAILLVQSDDTVTVANDPARVFFGPDIDAGDIRLWSRLEGGRGLAASADRARSLRASLMVHGQTNAKLTGGTARPLRIRIAPLSVDQDDAGSLVVVAEDVSETRELEEQMMRSERLASIGTLTAGLAHQIGNQLNTVKGYSDLLSRRLAETDERTRADLEAIRKAVRGAVELMDRLLLLARTRPPTDAPLHVPTVLREAIEMARLAAEAAGVEIVEQVQEPGCTAWGDPNLFCQAIINLMMNAVQAMPAGGTLTVSSDCAGGNSCTIRIEDDGPGMSPDTLLHAFDPFFTTKPEGQGTGLGLPIAQRIVELHGGLIRVQSEPGKGTTFTIEVAVEAAERSSAPAPMNRPEGVEGSKTHD
jgi:signal transduction histidine kinase